MSEYVVVTGDTSGTIAKQFGLPWDVIWATPSNKDLNTSYGGDASKLVSGDILFLPDPLQVKAPPTPGGVTVVAQKDRNFYLQQAYTNAFGTFDPQNWDPSQGFAANRPRIVKLYDYYAKLYADHPDKFYWAGLGKMAGGAVLGGLDFYLTLHSEDFVTRKMVQIGKDIFEDLAWLHEAYLDSINTALRLAQQRDNLPPTPDKGYAAAWARIDSADPAKVLEGNQNLLRNEQFVIIQPRYEDIHNNPGSEWEFDKTSVFTNNIHPYHRRFQLVLPQGNVRNAIDRWSWISEVDGMWAKWTAMPLDERKRLVALPMDDLIKQKWGTVIDSLLPPGAFDDEDEG